MQSIGLDFLDPRLLYAFENNAVEVRYEIVVHTNKVDIVTIVVIIMFEKEDVMVATSNEVGANLRLLQIVIIVSRESLLVGKMPVLIEVVPVHFGDDLAADLLQATLSVNLPHDASSLVNLIVSLEPKRHVRIVHISKINVVVKANSNDD